MSELHRVTIIEGLCGGRPTIRGMRICVKDILDLLAAGADRAEILENYPYIEDGDITAALKYASRQVDHAGRPNEPQVPKANPPAPIPARG
jgi:uncharacterized protein (DUF433 family)